MATEFNFTSVSQVKNKIREHHLQILDRHLDQFEKMFEPFVYDDILPYVMEYFERQTHYLDVYQDSLRTFLDIQIEKKVNFKDDRFLKLDFMEEFTKVNGKPENDFIMNLINQQRMMNLASGDEVNNLLAASDEIFTFWVKRIEVDGLEKEKIYLMAKWPKANEVFCFTTNNKILVYGPDMNKLREYDNNFGSVVAVNFYEDVCSVGNRAGNLFFIDVPEWKTTSVFHFSM
jgi:hypothetical protein